VDTCVHVVPGRWEYEIVVNATGESLRWFRDNLGHWEVETARKRGVSPYDVLIEEASEIPPGSEGVMYFPYLWGAKAPFFNPRAKGAFVGITHAHTRAHLIRAILEGVAFHYRGVLGLLAELGVAVKRLSLTGGEARSEVWNKIKASVAGMPLHVPKVLDAASLGAAILAAVGAKHYGDVRTAAENMVRFERVIDPDPRLAEAYEKLYEKYCAVYRRLEGAFELM
jgi:xylulokinase